MSDIDPAVIDGPPGRAGETAAIDRMLAELRAGRGGVVLLSGEGGVGKTTLSAWAVEAARHDGAHTLEAPCFALSSGTPYASLVAAFGPVVRQPPSVGATPVTHGLSTLGLLFDGVDWGSGALSADTGELARTRLHGAFATLVSRLSADAPVVLAIDDLHWADTATVEVLHALTVDLPDVALLVVATMRPYEAAQRAEIQRLVRTWRRAGWACTLDIEGLDRRATGELVQRRLAGFVPARVLDLIHERSGGTPLVAEELTEAMVQSGVLRPIGRRWEISGVGDIPTVAIADDLIGDRLARLAPDALRLVATIAVAGEAVTDAELAAVADIPIDRIERETGELRQAGLVDRAEVLGDTAWVVHHPIIGEVAMSAVGDDVVRDLHRGFVDRLDGAGVERLGRHVLGAGAHARDDRHVRVLLEAGRSAMARGAPEQGCTLLAAALDAIDNHGARDAALPEVLVALGRAWTRRGEFKIALHHLERADELASERNDVVARADLLADLHDATWGARATDGHFDQRYVELRAELEARGEWIAAHRLLRSEMMRLAREGRIDVAERFLDEASRIEANVDDPEVGRWHRQLEVFATLDRFVDGAATLRALDTYLADARAAADVALERRLLHERLDLLLAIGSRSQVAEAMRDEQVFGERHGDWPTWRIGIAAWDIAMGVGDLARATEVEIVLQMGANDRASGYVQLGRTLTGLANGEPSPIGDDFGDSPDRVVQHLAALARWWQGGGDRDAICAEVIERWSRRRFIAGMPLFAPVTAGLAMIESGVDDALDDVITTLERFDDGVGRTSAWAAILRADAAADATTRARHRLDAAERFAALERPFDAATCVLAAAECGGDVPPALIADAATRFADLPGSWLADRLAAAVGAGGRAVGRDPTDDPLGLTAREREVAEVVAEGLSNREVANRLYISVRTVTSHLDHIYTKLGIGSRQELAALVAGQEP